MIVVLAPTAFKGHASPMGAAEAIASGWRRVRPRDELRLLPVADGGDGTAEVLRGRLGGRWLSAIVRGPVGEPVRATALLLPDGSGVVEMASASGLALIAEGRRDPMHADTRGTGELIRVCLDEAAGIVYLGVGGSATVDGGTGCAHSLGIRFVDGEGRELEPVPAELVGVARVERAALDARASRVVALADVTNPLLGPRGAAAVYGPQKGAGPDDVAALEAVLGRLADASGTPEVAKRPGAGAAGGLAFGVAALLGGTIVPGAATVLDLLGFDETIADAGLVVTGEGRLDAQTMAGKAPAEVAHRARERGVRCVAVVGVNELGPEDLGRIGIDAVFAAGGRPIEEAGAELASSVE